MVIAYIFILFIYHDMYIISSELVVFGQNHHGKYEEFFLHISILFSYYTQKGRQLFMSNIYIKTSDPFSSPLSFCP
jgi:hypothetical protein